MGSLSIRKSNIEMIRIIAMFFIVISHWGGHGSWTIETRGEILVNYIFLQLTNFIGEIGNCLFLLITGYFCIEKNTFSFRSVKKIIVESKLYAFSLWLLIILSGVGHFSIGSFIKALFPIIYSQYWFIGTYLIIYLIYPVINLALNTFDYKIIKIYFMILFVTQLILPVFKSTYFVSNVALFILYYSIGAMYRKGYFSNIKKHVNLYVYFCLSIIIPVIIIIICNYLDFRGLIDIKGCIKLIGRFSVFPVGVAVGIFLIMLRNKFTNIYINKVAGSVFAVYLISENPNLYPWIWTKFFDNMKFYNSDLLIFVAIGETLLIMSICIGMDIIIKSIFKIMRNIRSKSGIV